MNCNKPCDGCLSIINSMYRRVKKKRLIDADKLVDMLYDNEFAALCPLDEVSGVIDACPTVDAVPVVRCRECRYYAVPGATISFCIHRNGMKFTRDSDYCSRGERRDQSADVRNMEGGNEHECAR